MQNATIGQSYTTNMRHVAIKAPRGNGNALIWVQACGMRRGQLAGLWEVPNAVPADVNCKRCQGAQMWRLEGGEA